MRSSSFDPRRPRFRAAVVLTTWAANTSFKLFEPSDGLDTIWQVMEDRESVLMSDKLVSSFNLTEVLILDNMCACSPILFYATDVRDAKSRAASKS